MIKNFHIVAEKDVKKADYIYNLLKVIQQCAL